MLEQKWFLCDKRRGRSYKWSDYKSHIVRSPTLRFFFLNKQTCVIHVISQYSRLWQEQAPTVKRTVIVFGFEAQVFEVCVHRGRTYMCSRDPCAVTRQPEMSQWESGALKAKRAGRRSAKWDAVRRAFTLHPVMGWQASRDNTNCLDTDTIEGKPDTIGTFTTWKLLTLGWRQFMKSVWHSETCWMRFTK